MGEDILGAGDWDAWYNRIFEFSSDVIQIGLDAAEEAYQFIVLAANNSWASTVQLVSAALQEAYEYHVDYAAGLIDGFLDTINPFDRWWSFPNIGAVYGHQGAYTAGYVSGVVVGIGVGFAIGFATGGAGAVGLLANLGKAYTAIDTIAGMAVVIGKGLSGEKLGVLDALAFSPAIGRILDCFVSGTGVWMAGCSEEIAAITPAVGLMIAESVEENSDQLGTFVLFVTGSLLAIPLAIRLSRKKEPTHDLDNRQMALNF